MGGTNINRWAKFYQQFFTDAREAESFVSDVEALCSGEERHTAKVMMHQTQRLISLADDLPSIRNDNETLQLLFLLICAEHIAKLADGFTGEGQSRAYVRHFFEWFLSADEQRQLAAGITAHDHEPFTLEQAVHALYDVRCDVVHEGRYWGFHFSKGEEPMLNCEPDVIVSLAIADFRRFVVNGCINAIRSYPRRRVGV